MAPPSRQSDVVPWSQVESFLSMCEVALQARTRALEEAQQQLEAMAAALDRAKREKREVRTCVDQAPPRAGVGPGLPRHRAPTGLPAPCRWSGRRPARTRRATS